MHEIVTLQFGQQANYLGTHYWNTQESYFTYDSQPDSPVNHDISFRAGRGVDGQETYTPRTVIYDLKGAFGTLRRENALYALDQTASTEDALGWTGSAVPLRLPRIEASPYQTALDSGSALPILTNETVRFWSDYNHIFYHPRSICQINEYELNSSLLPFERFETGLDLFAQLDREFDLLDRDLRPFLEECDQLQGIQVFSSIDDAWGGFAAKYVENIADELGKGSRWIFGLQDAQRSTRQRDIVKEVNVAQSMSSLCNGSTLQIPLSTKPSRESGYLKIDANSKWQTSALQATVLESVTLPTRLRTSQTARATFDELETTLNNEGHRQIAAASMSLRSPSPLETMSSTNGNTDSRMRNGLTNGLTNGITPGMTNGITNGDHDYSHDLDISLFPSSIDFSSAISRFQPPPRSNTFSRTEVLRGHWLSENLIGRDNARMRDRFSEVEGPRRTAYQTNLLAPTLPSFPRIFDLPQASDEDVDQTRFAAKSYLSTSTVVAHRLRGLEGVVRRAVGVEEREALSDNLLSLANEYVDGWSDDDSGTDDE